MASSVTDYEYCDESDPLLDHVRCFVCQSPSVLPVRLAHVDPATDCGATACRGCYDHFAAQQQQHRDQPPRCPNCRRPCTVPPAAPDPLILRLLGGVAVRCGYCAAGTTVGDAVSHLRNCVPRRVALLTEGHDWSRVPHAVCRRTTGECTPRHCAWVDHVLALLNTPTPTDAVRAFLTDWIVRLVDAGDGYVRTPQFLRLLREQPALTSKLWLDAVENLTHRDGGDGRRRPPRRIPTTDEVCEILHRLTDTASAVYGDIHRHLDRAAMRSVFLGDAADARKALEFCRLRPQDACLPGTAYALHYAATRRDPPGCSAGVAALCADWWIVDPVSSSSATADPETPSLVHWSAEDFDALIRQPLLPAESLAKMAVARASAAAAAVWRERRTREGAFPLPVFGGTFSWSQAAATLLSLADDDVPALMRTLQFHVHRAVTVGYPTQPFSEVRLVDDFGAAFRHLMHGGGRPPTEGIQAGLAALAGGIVVDLLRGVCGDAVFAMPPCVAVAVPVTGLTPDMAVRPIEAEARLLCVHRNLQHRDFRESQLGYFVLVARILGNAEQEVNGFLTACRDSLRRAATACLPLAMMGDDGGDGAWGSAAAADRTLQTRVVLLLVGLGHGRPPTCEGFVRALRWLAHRPGGALPRARWWYDLTVVRELCSPDDAVILEPANLAFLVRRVGFGRRAGHLEQRLMWVRSSEWTPAALTTVLEAAPREFADDLVWARMFASSAPRETAEAILGRSDALYGRRDWAVVLRLHHVLPSVRPPPARALTDADGGAAAARLVHAGGADNPDALHDTLVSFFRYGAAAHLAGRWYAAATPPPTFDSTWSAIQDFVFTRMLPWAQRITEGGGDAGMRLPDAFFGRWMGEFTGPDGWTATAQGWLGALGTFVRLAGDEALQAFCSVLIANRRVLEDAHRHRAIFESYLYDLTRRIAAGPFIAELCLFLCMEASPDYAARFPLEGIGPAAAAIHRCTVGVPKLCTLLNRAARGGAHLLWAIVITFNPTVRTEWAASVASEDKFGAFGEVMAAVGERPHLHDNQPFVVAAIILILELMEDRLAESESDWMDDPMPSDLLGIVRVALDIAADGPSAPLLRVCAAVHPAHLGDVNPESIGRLVRHNQPETLPYVATILYAWLTSNTAQTVHAVLADGDGLSLFLTRLVRIGATATAEALESVIADRGRELVSTEPFRSAVR